MGGNLAKAPLVAVFYASLIWFVMAFLPRSESYVEAAAEFTMPLLGLLMIIAYGFLAAVAYAVAYGGTHKGGVSFAIMLILSAAGLQWAAPTLRQLMLGETTGVMTGGDTLFQLLGCFGATVLTLILVMLLYKTTEKPAHDHGSHPEPKYKLRRIGLVVKLLVLPAIYFILYYLSWYFLFWRVPAVHTFYGVEQIQNFMGELIYILVNNGFQAVVTLLTGLAYVLFCMPLLFRMLGKRVPFIVSVTLLYLTGALSYLVPSPLMPDAVRMAHLMETGAVLLVYGVLSGLLLHTSFRRQEVSAPVQVEKPAAKPKKKTSEAASAK